MIIRAELKCMGYMMDSIASGMNKENLPVTDKILFLYLLHNDHSFYRLVSAKLKYFSDKIGACADREVKMFTEEFITEILPTQLKEINDYIMRRRDIIVGLERLLISDIFQDHRLTVFRTYRIEIQVGNGRHLLINLCQ